MGKIKVGIVNYLNTAPLLYGIQHSPVNEQIDLVFGYPANIARWLQNGDIDLGLVPIAVIPQLKDYRIITDYCIGCDGPVASVALFSDSPIDKIKNVLLDYESRTSVALAKILLKNYWNIHPQFTDASPDYRKLISGTTAGVVIGDRALEQRSVSSHIYDLGEAWKAFTGLPFLFAAWISNRPLSAEFVSSFNEANRFGIQNIPLVAAANPYPYYDLLHYYTSNISYELDDRKRIGMEKFLSFISPRVGAVG